MTLTHEISSPRSVVNGPLPIHKRDSGDSLPRGSSKPNRIIVATHDQVDDKFPETFSTEAFLDRVLSSCFSLNERLVEPKEMAFSSPVVTTQDVDSPSSSSCATGISIPSEPQFQQRGRFLVWPASFGLDYYEATIASRT
jgi:hypothetical protein